MNQDLQDILSALDDAGPVNTELIRNAVKALSDELELLAFKLSRSEKIKRTTAVFLDESVTELEEKRRVVEEVNTALESSLAELKATQAQLVESEKLASLGALTAGSYDLFVTASEPVGEDFSYTVTVSAVPLPAAVWLFGSALFGFGFLTRRKSV